MLLIDFYKKLLPAILLADPESAHDFVVRALSVIDRVIPRSWPSKAPGIRIAGIDFSNPIGLAAGFDKNGEFTNVMAALGFGFIEVGTITPRPQSGNEKPRIFRLPEEKALINRLGFNSQGCEAVVKNLQRRTHRVPVGINVGPNRDDSPSVSRFSVLDAMVKLSPFADYLVLNLSSPNTPNLRSQLEASPDTLDHFRTGLDEAEVKTPLFLKISPDMANDVLEQVLLSAVKNKIAALIATNTTVTRTSLSEDSIGQMLPGGLSGQPLKERSSSMIRRIYSMIGEEIPIIGVGGISTPEDVEEKMDSGAKLVQLYTGLIYEGPGLPAYLAKNFNKNE